MNKFTRTSLVFSLVLLLALATGLLAQEREVFAPFVSRIRAAVKEHQVKLSWSDSPDLVGDYLVYRHRAEIETANLSEAVLIGQVDQGVESFIDTPPEKGRFFYAVLARARDGKLFDILIPFRNKLMNAVAVEAAPSEKDRAVIVSGLRALGEGNRITLRFKTSRSDRSLMVLRSGSPFADAASLSRAPFSAIIPSSEASFTDYPVPGIPSYYAVLDEAMVKAGLALLVPGENMTTSYAEIPLGTRFVGMPPRETAPRRTLPLPYYRLSSELASGTGFAAGAPAGLPQRKTLSAPTRKAIDRLLLITQELPVAVMQARLLPAEKIPPTNPEEGLLGSIMSGSFAAADWPTAAQLLRNFLSVPRTEDVRTRALFYLGQALFFAAKYETSFTSFQSAEGRLGADCRPWMDAILARLASYSSAEGL